MHFILFKVYIRPLNNIMVHNSPSFHDMHMAPDGRGTRAFLPGAQLQAAGPTAQLHFLARAAAPLAAAGKGPDRGGASNPDGPLPEKDMSRALADLRMRRRGQDAPAARAALSRYDARTADLCCKMTMPRRCEQPLTAAAGKADWATSHHRRMRRRGRSPLLPGPHFLA